MHASLQGAECDAVEAHQGSSTSQEQDSAPTWQILRTPRRSRLCGASAFSVSIGGLWLGANLAATHGRVQRWQQRQSDTDPAATSPHAKS